MTIVICSPDYPPRLGGISRFSHSLAKHLAVRDNVTVLTVRMPHHKEFDARQGFVTRRVPNIPILRELLQLHGIFALHQKEPIDWIVNAVWFPCGLLSYVGYRMAGIRYMVVAHGSDILDDRLTWKRTVKGWLRTWKAEVLARSSAVLPNSTYTRMRLQREGVRSPMEVLNPGVDVEVFCPGPRSEPLMRRLAIEPGTFVLLSVGRLDLHKGHDIVIDALPLILREVPNLVYLIVGDGPERTRLQQSIDHLGLAAHIRMPGSVQEEDLVEYYRLCDTFILPSREIPGRTDLIEGFGMAFIEAGACGKPVIAGRSGGVPDAVLDGVTGVLIDPTDTAAVAEAVVRLCRNPAYARELGRNGRKRCEDELAWPVVAGRLRAILEKSGAGQS